MTSAPVKRTTSSLQLATRMGYLVALAALLVLGYAFVTASSAAAESGSDAVFPRSLLGLPLLEGFRSAGRHGVHVQWGAIVLLATPVLVSVLALIAAIRRPPSTGRR